MNGEVIKSFLVGLGFGVDESSLQKFNSSIKSASLRVAALYAGVQAAAAGIFASISSISEGFEKMGYEYRIIAPAINKALMLREALLSAYRAAGINITKAVQASVLFNYSLAKTKFAFEAIYNSVGVKFLPLLTKQMDIFRGKIFAAMPRIQAALTKFVEFIFKAFDATAELGSRLFSILGRVWDFFVKLDDVTNGWSTKILAAVAAWQLLNLEFLATPIGMLIAGLTALLALYDDFKTFQEGGKSLFNWDKAIPVINALTLAFKDMYDAVDGVFEIIGDLAASLYSLFHGDWVGVLQGVKDAFSTVDNGIMNVLGQMLGGGAGNPGPQPLGVSQAQGNLTNQHVNQQTSIIVQGSADANSVGKNVADQQSKVNFDMTRNLKGATR